MPISFSGVTVVGYNASPPPDDGSAVSSNQLSWSKHLTKIGGPLKTALEELNANLVTAFGLGAATAAANEFTAAQTIKLAQAILNLESTAASTPLLRGYVSSVHRGGFGIVPSADSWGTGSIAFDTLIYSIATGLTISLDNGSTVALRLNSAGAITKSQYLSANEIGRLGAETQTKTADYTIVSSDAGKTIYATSACDEVIINDTSQIPVGTTVFILANRSGTVQITSGTGVTIYLAGTAWGTTGNRTIADGGFAYVHHFTSGTYVVGGIGVT